MRLRSDKEWKSFTTPTTSYSSIGATPSLLIRLGFMRITVPTGLLSPITRTASSFNTTFFMFFSPSLHHLLANSRKPKVSAKFSSAKIPWKTGLSPSGFPGHSTSEVIDCASVSCVGSKRVVEMLCICGMSRRCCISASRWIPNFITSGLYSWMMPSRSKPKSFPLTKCICNIITEAAMIKTTLTANCKDTAIRCNTGCRGIFRSVRLSAIDRTIRQQGIRLTSSITPVIPILHIPKKRSRSITGIAIPKSSESQGYAVNSNHPPTTNASSTEQPNSKSICPTSCLPPAPCIIRKRNSWLR